MQNLRKLRITLAFLLVGIFLCAQQGFSYKREILDVDDEWHKLALPDELFAKSNLDLSDLRILGINSQNDTLEVPYLLRIRSDEVLTKQVDFELINMAQNDGGYFFTLQSPVSETINEMELDFAQTNFDWRVRLEGSQNQNEWFRILEDYRILSIDNDDTQFRFTKLKFPSASYPFFRLRIQASEKPIFRAAKVSNQRKIVGERKEYTTRKIRKEENQTQKQTLLFTRLENPVPVDRVRIQVTDEIDYHRSFTLSYLSDSIKTEQGWEYLYRDMHKGVLNSLGENTFSFDRRTAKAFKLVVENRDNPSLNIRAVTFSGAVTEMVARFSQPANYFLFYGNAHLSSPNYDITRFSDKIPKNPKMLGLGAEQVIPQVYKSVPQPLFANPAWLWGILLLIMALLGWFSLKMLRKAEG